MPLTRISSSTTITNSRRKATDRTGEWRRALLHSPGSDYTEREGVVMSVITGATKQVQVIRPQQRKHLRSNLGTALILGGPAFLLLLVFLIGPFFMGVIYSFTDQRLISPQPAQNVGATAGGSWDDHCHGSRWPVLRHCCRRHHDDHCEGYDHFVDGMHHTLLIKRGRPLHSTLSTTGIKPNERNSYGTLRRQIMCGSCQLRHPR